MIPLYRLKQFVLHPGQLVRRLVIRGQMRCAHWLTKAPFFLQGQMDIQPGSRWHNPEFAKMTGGFFLPHDTTFREIVNLDPWDLVRRDMLILLLRSLLERNVPGDLAELGTWKGATAKLFHYYLPERKLHIFDTFAGFDERDLHRDSCITGQSQEQMFTDTCVAAVLQYINPKNQNIACHQGYFPDSIPPGFTERTFAFVHLDADLYSPIMAGLQFFYSRINPGGMIVVHDYNGWPGARQAVTDFFKDKPEIPIPLPDKSGSALIVKQ